MDDLNRQGAWRSGNRYALPTSPHPRRRISGLRDKRATLTPHWYKTSGNPSRRFNAEDLIDRGTLPRHVAELLEDQVRSGKTLMISHRTVEIYRARLMRKYKSNTTADLVHKLMAGE